MTAKPKSPAEVEAALKQATRAATSDIFGLVRGKPLPDFFKPTEIDTVLEQMKASSERLDSPEFQQWMATALAESEWAYQDEMTRLDARAEFEARQQPAPQAATPSAPPVEAESASGAPAGPLSLTTGEIAFCFAGLRWKTEKQWKKPLGDKPKWLEACIVIPGQRGVSEARWNPVCIGAALERQGHVNARSVRAAFQRVPLLAPWLDAWKAYEADYLDNN